MNDQAVVYGAAERQLHNWTHSPDWYPLRFHIYLAFGIKVDKLRYRVRSFQRKGYLTPVLEDAAYLIEASAEYLLIGRTLLNELDFAPRIVQNVVTSFVHNISANKPAALLCALPRCKDLVGDCLDDFLHDFDANAFRSLLRAFHKSPEEYPFVGFFVKIAELLYKQGFDGDYKWVMALRQLSEYLGRLLLTSQRESLEERAISDYVKQEEEMRNWVYDDGICQELKQVLSEWYPDEEVDEFMNTNDFTPSFSSGSSYGSTREVATSVYYKYNNLSYDSTLIDWLGDYPSLSTLPQVSEADFGYDPSLARYGRCSRVTPELREGLVRMCELVYVPKTVTKLRSISKEDPTLNYYQHGVQDMMVQLARKHISSHINYNRADLSAEMAREGSGFGEFSTYDLSAASDSVTIELVKKIFPKRLLKALIATRAEFVKLPDGEILRMKKFAPMGSCTCFPVETSVFAAICEVAARRLKVRRPKYRVYGDDIVCEVKLANEIAKLLEELHFKLNKTKSFTGMNTCNFREACGGEYYNNVDIKPLRVSRNRSGATTMSPDQLFSTYLDKIIECWSQYRELAHLFIKRMKLLKIKVRRGSQLIFAVDLLPWDRITGSEMSCHWDSTGTYSGKESVTVKTINIDPYEYCFEAPFKYEFEPDAAALWEWLRVHKNRKTEEEVSTSDVYGSAAKVLNSVQSGILTISQTITWNQL